MLAPSGDQTGLYDEYLKSPEAIEHEAEARSTIARPPRPFAVESKVMANLLPIGAGDGHI
jgi:hypothetical protein